MKLMNQFNVGYRDIETAVQDYARANFSIYRIYCKSPNTIGFNKVPDFFAFLHITHDSCLVPDNPNYYDNWALNIYRDILTTFKFNRAMWQSTWYD